MRKLAALAAVLSLLSSLETASAQTAADNGATGSGPTQRVPLTTDGNWHDFGFGGVGTVTGPIEFSGAGVLDIVDCCLSGDQFEIFLNGNSVGLTSAPTSTGDQIGGNFDGACADPRWSSAALQLGPGDHSIELVPVLSPFGAGALALRFPGQGCSATEVPTGPGYALLALALLLVAGGSLVLRRRLSA